MIDFDFDLLEAAESKEPASEDALFDFGLLDDTAVEPSCCRHTHLSSSSTSCAFDADATTSATTSGTEPLESHSDNTFFDFDTLKPEVRESDPGDFDFDTLKPEVRESDPGEEVVTECAGCRQQTGPQHAPLSKDASARRVDTTPAEVEPGAIVEAKEATAMYGSALDCRPWQQLQKGCKGQVLSMAGSRMLLRELGGLEGWVKQRDSDDTQLWHTLAKGGQVVVRHFQPFDRSCLEAIERASFSPSSNCIADLIDQAAMPQAQLFIFVAEELQPGRPGADVVGYVVWAPQGPVKQPSSLYIHRIAVAPERRSRGIGKELLTAAEQDGAERYPKVASVHLHVRTDNGSAFGLYLRMGFRPIKFEHKYYDDCDAWVVYRGLTRAVWKR